MKLNFNSIPKEMSGGGGDNAPRQLLPDGRVHATIQDASMFGKDSNHLQLVLKVRHLETGATGTIYDKFFASTKELPLFKIGQLLRSLGLEDILTGDFELNDLPKIVKGKEMLAEITSEENPGYSPRNVVQVFDNSIYYPASTPAPATGSESSSDLPFVAGDDVY